MSERAQLGPTPTWLPVTLIGGVILLLVGAEVRDRVAAVEGSVDYCGLCHVEPLVLVTALLALPLGVGVLLRIRSGRWRR